MNDPREHYCTLAVRSQQLSSRPKCSQVLLWQQYVFFDVFHFPRISLTPHLPSLVSFSFSTAHRALRCSYCFVLRPKRNKVFLFYAEDCTTLLLVHRCLMGAMPLAVGREEKPSDWYVPSLLIMIARTSGICDLYYSLFWHEIFGASTLRDRA